MADVVLLTAERPKAQTGVIHHLDHDHDNNVVENLAPGHFGCHTSHHHKGKTLSEEAKAKVSNAQKGVKDGPLPEETRRKISEALKGKPKSPEHVAKVAAKSRGRSPSPETREKMRQAKLGKKPSPEAVAKSAASNKGKKRSPETREKMRQAWERRRAANTE